MPIQTELTSIALIVIAALVCGLVAIRFKLPAIVGYIFAGIVLGPSGLALVEDRGHIGIVAELGVLLLLYTIGMQLSLRGFRAVWKLASGTATLQIVVSVGVMLLLGLALQWSPAVSVLLGFVIAISSTVVALRILEDMNLIHTQVGQIAISILIAQDLAVVPMILVVQMLAGGEVTGWDFVRIVAAAFLLGFLIWYLSRRNKVRLPLAGLLVRQVELRPLYGVGLCFGAALIAGTLELTAAYGAFLAGLVVGNSNGRNVMLRSVRPIQNLMMMAFFVAIGLLVDLQFIWDNVGTVVAIVCLVTIIKTLLNIGIIRLLGEPWPHAFVAGLLIAQIGEFSFLLGETGYDVGLINADEKNLIVAVTVITLLISPLWLVTARRIVRIAFSNARTLNEIVVRLRQGGIAAIADATRKSAPSPRAAALYFGRASSVRNRGVIGETEANTSEDAGQKDEKVP